MFQKMQENNLWISITAGILCRVSKDVSKTKKDKQHT